MNHRAFAMQKRGNLAKKFLNNMIQELIILIFTLSLFGKVSFVTAIGSVLIAIIIKLICTRALDLGTDSKLRINFSFIAYLCFLAKEMVISTYTVCKIILLSSSRNISPVVDSGSTKSIKGSSYLALYGNSITLTPSTITVDIDEQNVIVHSLLPDGMQGATILKNRITKAK